MRTAVLYISVDASSLGRGGLWLYLQVIHRNMRAASVHRLDQRALPELRGEVGRELIRSIRKFMHVIQRSEGVSHAVRPAAVLQHGVVEALHAHGDAIDPVGAQGVQSLVGEGAGVHF